MTLKENNKIRQCDNRRLGVERRQFSYDDYYPERRSGLERRRGDTGRRGATEREEGESRKYSGCPEM